MVLKFALPVLVLEEALKLVGRRLERKHMITHAQAPAQVF